MTSLPQPQTTAQPGRARRATPFTMLLAVALLAALLAHPGQQAASAQDGIETYERLAAILETTTGPAEDYPVTLDYDLYIPDGASAEDPRPAMVLAHGFGNNKAVAEMTTLGAFFAGKGYIVIASSHQGFGASSGCVALDSMDYDSRNVTRLIDVLAARDDVQMEAPGDPVVGMAGGSYGGGHQGGVAALDPRLDAMSPGRTWNSLQYSLVPNNVIGDGGIYDLEHYEQGVFKATWSSLFFASGSTQPLMGNGGCDPATQQTLYPGQPPCSGFDPIVCPIFANLRSSGDVSAEQREVVARSSVANITDRITIPVLLTQGQSDTLFNLWEATATYQALRPRGDADVMLLWNDGGHGYQPQPGEGEPYSGAFGDSPEAQEAFRATYFADRYARFFDFHLLGIGHPGPRFAFYPSWDESYIETGTAPTNDGVSLLLTDDGLVGPGGPPTSFSASLVNPANGDPAAHSETPNFTGPGQPGAGRQPEEVPGQHVALDTAPFTAPATVVGLPTLRVGVANSNGRDAVLFTKLYDVAPDGSATLIRRLVNASRIPAASLPGIVELRVPAIAHRFETGHAVRLVVATTDDSYRNAPVADQITLSSDPADPAVLRLPLEGADHIGRLAGADRIATAVALSERAFGESRSAVLAAAGSFPDALSAGPLAAIVGGPLLLTGADALDPRVQADLQRLGVEQVYMVGGELALAPAVSQALVAGGMTVTRLAGADRFATSEVIARELSSIAGGPRSTAVIARGDDFADALSAGSLAARLGVPIVLLDGAHVDAVATLVRDVVVADAELLVAGGEQALAPETIDALGRPVRRLAGPDRYATAAALATEAVASGVVPDPLLLASGATFPDALAAVPAAHRLGGMVLTIPPSRIIGGTATQVLLDAVAPVANTAFAVGGTAVLPDVADDEVAAALVAAPQD